MQQPKSAGRTNRACQLQQTAVITALILLPAATALAARPLTVDDAGTVAKGGFEFDAGVEFDHSDGDDSFGLPVGLTYGVNDELQVGIGSGAQSTGGFNFFSDSGARGLQDFSVSAKWNPVKDEKHGLMLALAGGIKFPTASRGMGSGDYDYDLTAIATKTRGNTSFDLNLGYTFQGASQDPSLTDSFHYGVALRHAVSKGGEAGPLTLVAELFGDRAMGDNHLLHINGGCQYELRPTLILDAAIGTGIGRSGGDVFVTVGLTRPF